MPGIALSEIALVGSVVAPPSVLKAFPYPAHPSPRAVLQGAPSELHQRALRFQEGGFTLRDPRRSVPTAFFLPVISFLPVEIHSPIPDDCSRVTARPFPGGRAEVGWAEGNLIMICLCGDATPSNKPEEKEPRKR